MDGAVRHCREIIFATIIISGLLSGTTSGLAAALSPLTLIVPGIVLAHSLWWPLTTALLIPVLFPVFHYALINSALRTLLNGGVRWRETFYPLNVLRAGNVR